MAHQLINKRRVRKLALELAENHRRMADGTPRFTRVSNELYDGVEGAIRSYLNTKIHAMPSAGRTL